MEIWNKVRSAYYNPPDSITPAYAELARRFNLDPRTVRKMIELPAPPGYRMEKPRPLKGLAPHLEFIEQLLIDDVGKHKKQRLSAARIYEILCKDRGFTGSERAVRSLVAKMRHHYKEVFVPLIQPKSRAQVDFYEARVIMDGIEQKAYCFNMVPAYSDGRCPAGFYMHCTSIKRNISMIPLTLIMCLQNSQRRHAPQTGFRFLWWCSTGDCL